MRGIRIVTALAAAACLAGSAAASASASPQHPASPAAAQQALPGPSWHKADKAEMQAAGLAGKCQASNVVHRHQIIACINKRGYLASKMIKVNSTTCSHCRGVVLTSAAERADVSFAIPYWSTHYDHEFRRSILTLHDKVTTITEPREYHAFITLYVWSTSVIPTAHIYDTCGAGWDNTCSWRKSRVDLAAPDDSVTWTFSSLCRRHRFFTRWHVSGVSDSGQHYSATEYFPSKEGNKFGPDKPSYRMSHRVRGCPYS